VETFPLTPPRWQQSCLTNPRRQFEDAIDRDPIRLFSAASLLEVSIIVESRFGEAGGRELDLLLHRAPIDVAAVSVEQVEIARRAFRRYGKGRHPAGWRLLSLRPIQDLGRAVVVPGRRFHQDRHSVGLDSADLTDDLTTPHRCIMDTGVDAMRKLVWAGLVFAAALGAQFDTATVLGTVRDKSGGVVVGAKVTLANLETGIRAARVTSARAVPCGWRRRSWPTS